MGFSTDECAWKHISIKVLAKKIIGLRGFSFAKETETEYLYGEGDEPIDIQTGNKGYPCSLKVLKYELDEMNDAAIAAGYADISEVPHELIVITCQYKKTLQSRARTLTAMGVKFNSLKFEAEQNAKMQETTLPALAMKLVIL